MIHRLLLVGFMSLLLAASVAGPAVAELGPGGSFVDDDGNVHEAYIEAIAAEGITRGCNPPRQRQVLSRFRGDSRRDGRLPG